VDARPPSDHAEAIVGILCEEWGRGNEFAQKIYECDDLVARDKASLDIFWLKDESLADSDNLPPPEVIAQEIVDDLEAALEQFRLIAADLNGAEASTRG
jgi:hypothetical protein